MTDILHKYDTRYVIDFIYISIGNCTITVVD